MTETQNTYVKPEEKDLQMKYYAESFTLKENVCWKGEEKKDHISTFIHNRDRYQNFTSVKVEEALKIHQNLLETNETYSDYYKQFSARNPDKVNDGVESAAYLDMLILHGIMTVELNEIGKLIKETRDRIKAELLYDINNSIKSNKHTISEELDYLNGNESRYGYSIGKLDEDDIKKSTHKINYGVERRLTTFNRLVEYEGKIDGLESGMFYVRRTIEDIF